MTQRFTEEIFDPLTEKEKLLAAQIVDSAIRVHKILGPGLLESVYEKCFCHELGERNIPYIRQQLVKITYDNLVIDEGLRVDVLVDNLIIIELKARDEQHPVWKAQLLSYINLLVSGLAIF